MRSMRNTAVLLIDCPDRKGLVAGVANLLYQFGANITHADQHQDPEAELFFMRVEWGKLRLPSSRNSGFANKCDSTRSIPATCPGRCGPRRSSRTRFGRRAS